MHKLLAHRLAVWDLELARKYNRPRKREKDEAEVRTCTIFINGKELNVQDFKWKVQYNDLLSNGIFIDGFFKVVVTNEALLNLESGSVLYKLLREVQTNREVGILDICLILNQEKPPIKIEFKQCKIYGISGEANLAYAIRKYDFHFTSDNIRRSIIH